MNLATLCDMYLCRGENGTSGCHLAVFSMDVALAHHFVALYHPLPSPLQKCLWY